MKAMCMEFAIMNTNKIFDGFSKKKKKGFSNKLCIQTTKQ